MVICWEIYNPRTLETVSVKIDPEMLRLRLSKYVDTIIWQCEIAFSPVLHYKIIVIVNIGLTIDKSNSKGNTELL